MPASHKHLSIFCPVRTSTSSGFSKQYFFKWGFKHTLVVIIHDYKIARENLQIPFFFMGYIFNSVFSHEKTGYNSVEKILIEKSLTQIFPILLIFKVHKVLKFSDIYLG